MMWLCSSDNMSEFKVDGEELIIKRVRKSGNSGRVYLPPKWIDRDVAVVLIEKKQKEVV